MAEPTKATGPKGQERRPTMQPMEFKGCKPLTQSQIRLASVAESEGASWVEVNERAQVVGVHEDPNTGKIVKKVPYEEISFSEEQGLTFKVDPATRKVSMVDNKPLKGITRFANYLPASVRATINRLSK